MLPRFVKNHFLVFLGRAEKMEERKLRGGVGKGEMLTSLKEQRRRLDVRRKV
jgi:hypothetical protein